MNWDTWINEGHYTMACLLLNKFLPPLLRGRFDTADFVQDAITEILGAPTTFNLDRPIFHLILKIARRRIFDECRRCWRELDATVMFLDDQGTPINSVSHEPSPFDMLSGTELRSDLIALGPTDRLRRAIELRLDGYELCEIEQIIGWKRGVAHMTFKRFKVKLSHKLNNTSVQESGS